MKLHWIACALLVVGCGSKKSEDRGDQTGTPTTAADPPAEKPGAEADEQACRDTGDGAACIRAARYAAGHTRAEIAFELYELACLHGDANGCTERATQERTPALLNGMACRRGAAAACDLADEWAAKVAGRVTAASTTAGEVGDKLGAVYLHTITDCIAALPAAERNRARTIAVSFSLVGGKPSQVVVKADTTVVPCVSRVAARWRFVVADGGPFELVAEVSALAEPPAAK